MSLEISILNSFATICISSVVVTVIEYITNTVEEIVEIEQKPKMTPEKILEVIGICKKKLLEYPNLSFDYSNEEILKEMLKCKKPDDGKVSGYCAWMLDQMEKQIKENNFEIGKINRWLGFIQGCSWVIGVNSINEMMDHNRPENNNS